MTKIEALTELHQQALDAAREEGRRAGLKEAAKVADNCVEQECCGCFHIVQISEDEGYEECCGNPNITPMYPSEVASKIRALIDAPADAEAARKGKNTFFKYSVTDHGYGFWCGSATPPRDEVE